MTHHSLPIRIYYEDTDAGGVVYHANYQKFAERARTEFLRMLGYTNSELEAAEKMLFVVRRAEIDYLKPSCLDDSLSLETAIETIKNTSLVMHQRAVRGADVICDMHVTLVCVDTNNFKPKRLPDRVRAAFEKYRER